MQHHGTEVLTAGRGFDVATDRSGCVEAIASDGCKLYWGLPMTQADQPICLAIIG